MGSLNQILAREMSKSKGRVVLFQGMVVAMFLLILNGRNGYLMYQNLKEKG